YSSSNWKKNRPILQFCSPWFKLAEVPSVFASIWVSTPSTKVPEPVHVTRLVLTSSPPTVPASSNEQARLTIMTQLFIRSPFEVGEPRPPLTLAQRSGISQANRRRRAPGAVGLRTGAF